MDTDSTSNGHQNGGVRVKFGTRPTQDIPVEWAEAMLTLLATEHQKTFSTLLARVALQGK